MTRCFLFVIMIFSFINGCSKDISRKEAINKLKQIYPLNVTVTMKKNMYVFSNSIVDYNGVLNESQQRELEEAESKIKRLKESGFFDYVKRESYYDIFDKKHYNIYYNLLPGSKATSYQVGNDDTNFQFVVATKTIDKVTGITKIDSSHCKVEYTSTLKKNELYDLLNISISFPSSENHMAYFVLYDDGWRLEKVDEVVERGEAKKSEL